MSEFVVYILYSPEHDKMYTGYTSNLIERFKSHDQLAKTGWTCRYRPWLVLYTEVFSERVEAAKREKELKSGKGRDWIKNNIEGWKNLFR